MKSTIQAGPRLLRDSTIKEEPPYSCEDIDPRHRFLRQMQDAFDRASVEAGGTIDRNLQIADLPVCLRFAGPKLIFPLMRALGSAAEFNGHIQPFKIHVWDTQSTGVILPAPPWKLDDFAEQGKIRGFFGGSTFILFQWASYSLSVLDTERRTGFFWMKDASDIPYFEKAAPFRVLFHLYMRARNIQFLHSAAIGMKEGGALVVGKAGAGKSTTMLASLRSDLLCAADDYCLVSGDAPVFVHNIYNSAKLNGDSLTQLPFIAPFISNMDRPDHEKGILYLRECMPQKLITRFPLRAILIPRVTGTEHTFLRAAAGGDAMSALAPSTILQLPGADGTALQRIASLIKHVPSYFLELGIRMEEIPEIITALLLKLNN